MDWHGNVRSFNVPVPESSIGFLNNFNQYHPLTMEMKHQAMAEPQSSATTIDKYGYGNSHHHQHHHQEKKKKLTNDQLELLERSFQEEIKLDPDRKMRLSRELGLQPRQITIWFQNRRARWKTKQLERLYDSLKQEFDVVSREKLKLQEEVLRLKAMMSDIQVAKKRQLSSGYMEISGVDETVESPRYSSGIHRPNELRGGGTSSAHQQAQVTTASGYQPLAVQDYNSAASNPGYWGLLPPSSYP